MMRPTPEDLAIDLTAALAEIDDTRRDALNASCWGDTPGVDWQGIADAMRPYVQVCLKVVEPAIRRAVVAELRCEHLELQRTQSQIKLQAMKKTLEESDNYAAFERLKAENARLLRGEFTAEEIQTILHNSTQESRRGWEQTIRDYSSKLCGISPIQANERERFRAHYSGQTEPCCECGEDYPRADLVFDREIYCEKCRVEEAKRRKK